MFEKNCGELSEKNKYYIPKHRYYELKHFCLQYPIWKKAYHSLDGLSKRPVDLQAISKTYSMSDPTTKCVDAKMVFFEKMQMVEQSAIASEPEIANYILKAVTGGFSYEFLRTSLNIPCCRDSYYKAYRKFFWILSKARN